MVKPVLFLPEKVGLSPIPEKDRVFESLASAPIPPHISSTHELGAGLQDGTDP